MFLIEALSLLAWHGGAFPGMDGGLLPPLHGCRAEWLCAAKASKLIVYVCYIYVRCYLWDPGGRKKKFFLCSKVSFIIGVAADGTGRIYVLNSQVPRAFSSASRGWSEAMEDSKERFGNFPNCQGVGCVCGTQSAVLFTGCSVGARFPKEAGVGRRLGLSDLICSAGATGFLARAT